MIEYEVAVPDGDCFQRAADLISGCCLNDELIVSRDGTLRSYPGSRHMHITKEGRKGTLESTIWPAGKRIWLKVQSRRKTSWVEAAAERVRTCIENGLAS